MNTRDTILLAEYLLARELAEPDQALARATKIADDLAPEGQLLTHTFGLDPNTTNVTRSACQIHDLLADYTQALALAVPDTAADSLPGGRTRPAVPLPWTKSQLLNPIDFYQGRLANHGWSESDLLAVANALPRESTITVSGPADLLGFKVDAAPVEVTFSGDDSLPTDTIVRLVAQRCDPNVGALIEREGKVQRFDGEKWVTLVSAAHVDALTSAAWELLASLTEVDDATPDAELPALLVSEAKRQRKLGMRSPTQPALYSTRQAIADAGLPVTLSAADAVKHVADVQAHRAALTVALGVLDLTEREHLALLADFDKLRRTIDSVQRERDALAAMVAASKEPKQMPQRIYDALSHVWPQPYADRIAKVGNALAALGFALDCEICGSRFDLLLTEHNGRVQLRTTGEAVVTGDTPQRVEIESLLKQQGWEVF